MGAMGRGGGGARFVYVIAQAGMKFGINFTSCRENGNEMHKMNVNFVSSLRV